MKIVTLRNIHIGKGIPKVFVPIAEQSRGDIIAMGKKLAAMPLDAVEWRADFYDGLMDTGAVGDTLKELRSALGDIPLIFTCRTLKEGGNADMANENYAALNRMACDFADGIDIEVLSFDDASLIRDIHNMGRVVIGSCHLMNTPPKGEMVEMLRRIQDTGADILKLAVQARCHQDALDLLWATSGMHREYAHAPIISMATGEEGVVSRIAGGIFGSAATFAAVGRGSAAGQLSLDTMNELLRTIHDRL